MTIDINHTKVSYINQKIIDFRLWLFDKRKLFSMEIWDGLTQLPYCRISSSLVDRHVQAREGGDHG
jgi:hypothetical protein